MSTITYKYILNTREANQTKSKSEAGPLSSSNTYTGAHSIQHSKHDSGQDGQGSDLIERQGTLGDKDGRSGNHETLDQILNNSVYNFSESVAHHCSIMKYKKKTRCGYNGV